MSATSPRQPIRYCGVGGVAAWLGVKPGTVTTWVDRYEDTRTPTPVADIELEPGRHGVPDKGWAPERKDEWIAWRESRPGRGAPGQPRSRKTRPKAGAG
jgi:hypothetical protein